MLCYNCVLFWFSIKMVSPCRTGALVLLVCLFSTSGNIKNYNEWTHEWMSSINHQIFANNHLQTWYNPFWAAQPTFWPHHTISVILWSPVEAPAGLQCYKPRPTWTFLYPAQSSADLPGHKMDPVCEYRWVVQVKPSGVREINTIWHPLTQPLTCFLSPSLAGWWGVRRQRKLHRNVPYQDTLGVLKHHILGFGSPPCPNQSDHIRKANRCFVAIDLSGRF